MKYEVVKILEVDYLRVPCLERGWCTGCVNASNIINRKFCDELEQVHTDGCIGSILIHTTPEAFESYAALKVAARLEGKE